MIIAIVIVLSGKIMKTMTTGMMIKYLNGAIMTEAYSETCQTSGMELNGF